MQPTTLSLSSHVKIGWLLRSHPTYTHQKTATASLIERIGATPPVELELSPHSLTHRGENNEVVRTHALKVVTVPDDAEAVLDGLIESLTRTPNEFKYSTTVDFKLIPFQNNAISRDGLAELFTWQNNFLHNTMATSVVDGGDCRTLIPNEQQSIVQICMDKRGRMGCSFLTRLSLAGTTSVTSSTLNT